MTILEGFRDRTVDVDGVAIHAAVGGDGPPVLLLHGYPQTHAMWHRVAPALAREHTVVAADLRGYGDSAKPAAGPDHRAYGKRAMAADQAGLMTALGFDRFAVVGHDRGARVGHRMAVDLPERVERLAVLDVVPTGYVLAHVDRALAQAYYHWFFLAQPADLPERLIGADPEFFLRRSMSSWAGDDVFDPAATAEYVRCFRDPAAIAASCEDYRAGASVDVEDAEADERAGRRVRCPLLALWGARGFVGAHYDVLDVWHGHTDHGSVAGHAVDCGHFLPEEAPGATTTALRDFLGRPAENLSGQ